MRGHSAVQSPTMMMTSGASPAAKATDGKPAQDAAMAARGPAETWPLPRAAIPPRADRPRRRADYQDPPDKAAGV